MDSMMHMSLATLGEALENRSLTATEITRACINRIAAVEDRIGAFLSINEEAALHRASEMDRAGRFGGLAGIPCAVKDNICVKGMPMTCASRMLEGFTAPYSATAWEKLEKLGCIMLGKTNMDEFGMGSSTEFSAFHPTHNPHDLSRTPGGSSGGSAAAVAAGMVPFALGSDTGGSIRQPASYCGVVGMKPTYGTVSRYGLTAFASSLEQIGPITRSVEDNALVMECIAGHDPRDGTSVSHPGGFKSQLGWDVKGLRIGVLKGLRREASSPEVMEAVSSAAAALERMGAELVEVDLPSLEYALPAYYIISSAEASSNLARFDGIRYGRRAADYEDLDDLYVRSRSEGFGDEVKRRILLGTYVLSEGYYEAFYKRALQVRTLVIRDFERLWGQVDCLLSPVSPFTAPALGSKQKPAEVYQGDLFTVPANVAGIPALAMPYGMDSRGLPIGVQLMGRAYSEPLLYRVGHALEKTMEPAIGEVKL